MTLSKIVINGENSQNEENQTIFLKYGLELAQQYFNLENKETHDRVEQFLKKFQIYHKIGQFAPLSAFFGGFVAQEIIKAITNKFSPVNQIFYTDCIEVLKDEKENLETENQQKLNVLSQLIGTDLQTKLTELNLFMVGCGAIGCELLKNFAMLDFGTGQKGLITITDPDHIETSNLNRQFLFREKHIRKSKAQTAAASAIQMNPKLKGHVQARLDKVHEGTEQIFSDKFFKSLDIVANALDNVQARQYVDKRCVNNRIPLMESGTLGTKGHVQCIIPFKTESYGSQNDPVEEGEIPYCTLKMFPEETFHCVEFARDKFGKLFTLRPKFVNKLLSGQISDISTPEELKQLKDTVKLLKQHPNSYQECVIWARKKFQKYFVNDIKQLLYTYPLDHKTKNGTLFWTMPKRPPVPIEYDSNNQLHVNFISTLAYLRYKMFNSQEKLKQQQENWRKQEIRQEIGKQADQVKIQPWIPNDEKKKQISSQVHKQEESKQQNEAEQTEEIQNQQLTLNFEQEKEMLQKEFQQLKKNSNLLTSQEFEKDDDSNGHIDYIYSLGNLRANGYKLDYMDWITVKIKAGRIVPALSTTTSIVAGLQTIELCKIIKQVPLDQMKNAFINIAIPYIQLTEPGPVPKIKLNESLEVTLWDKWIVNNAQNYNLKEFLELLEDTYKLRPLNIFKKGSPIYIHDIFHKQGKEKELNMILKTPLQELFNSEVKLIYISLLKQFKDEDFIDLVVNFTQIGKDEILKGVPQIKVVFKQQQLQ